ncbi:EthD domain-containing protein [Aldersonia sp. NBC_00410]|uniref:EthD domain-containing protein n=1 Tax=Aldersonia sp. NBC_00410 TaxID=2975954 RepID=UPI0022508072|nr:EthD domain-containing protein [Aldersonia sp. NBC_00410]MCX5044413.1 EthD domain-containing protein [Aldersonia sp. NBC_00410]
MQKSIYLLWAAADESRADEDWAQRLRTRLAALAGTPGVERIQLNVADRAVAEAMLRLTTFDVPVRAVVSVWSAPAAADIGTELASLCDRIAGYLVTETVALAPPATGLGERADALANVALLRRPTELEHREWLRRWQGDHTPIAIAVQGTFGYVQNEVRHALTPDAPAVDGIVEELFPMAALRDPHAFYGSGGDGAELNRRLRAMTDSIGRFGADRDIDVIPTSRYVF